LSLAGSEEWTLLAAEAALSSLSPDRLVWLTQTDRPERRLSASSGDRLLGSELDVIVYDAHGGFDPDSFGAALGALCGGGLLLLLTPPLESWPQLPDPQANRVAVHPFSATQVTGRFLERFARTLIQSDAVARVSESHPIPVDPVPRARIPPTIGAQGADLQATPAVGLDGDRTSVGPERTRTGHCTVADGGGQTHRARFVVNSRR